MGDYFPGTRVLVFDSTLFKNDKITPLSITMQSAIIIRWYGYKATSFPDWTEEMKRYPSLIDVKFDHDGRISHGHFIDYLEIIEATNV